MATRKTKAPSVRSEITPEYTSAQLSDDEIVGRAIAILESRLARPGQFIKSPADGEDFLRLKLAGREREIFAVLFLDNRHRVLAYEELFLGTIDQTTVHPREVVKRALELNAAALIISHNHPSGITTPSDADRAITKKLHDACDLVDIRLLDHIVVGAGKSASFAAQGLI